MRKLAETEERRQRSADQPLVGGGQHGVGKPRVDRLALTMKLLEALAVFCQRPAASLHPPPRLLGGDLEPDDDVAVEGLPDPLRVNGAAAQRDHPAVGVVEQALDLRRLQGPKLLLPALAEEGDDRHAELLLEHVVGVHRLQARCLSRLRGGGLASPHEADEDERRGAPRRAIAVGVAALYRRQSIRSL